MDPDEFELVLRRYLAHKLRQAAERLCPRRRPSVTIVITFGPEQEQTHT